MAESVVAIEGGAKVFKGTRKRRHSGRDQQEGVSKKSRPDVEPAMSHRVQGGRSVTESSVKDREARAQDEGVQGSEGRRIFLSAKSRPAPKGDAGGLGPVGVAVASGLWESLWWSPRFSLEVTFAPAACCNSAWPGHSGGEVGVQDGYVSA